MGNITQESGGTVKKMEMAIGILTKDKIIWANGKMVKLMVWVFIHKKMAESTRDSFRILSNMELEEKSFLMVIFMMVNIMKGWQPVKGPIHGRISFVILGNS